MTTARCNVPACDMARPGLSMIEVTVSVVIVGVMMVAALSTLSSVAMTRRIDADGQVGRMLAEQLMAEILSKAYEDPDLAPRSFGIEADELATGDRSLYDDIDDYDGWTACPPQMPDGTPISERTEWTRTAEVVCVNLVDFDNELPPEFEAGAKRITVTVTHNGEEIAQFKAVRGRTREHPF